MNIATISSNTSTGCMPAPFSTGPSMAASAIDRCKNTDDLLYPTGTAATDRAPRPLQGPCALRDRCRRPKPRSRTAAGDIETTPM
jgi:hypothetical protein